MWQLRRRARNVVGRGGQLGRGAGEAPPAHRARRPSGSRPPGARPQHAARSCSSSWSAGSRLLMRRAAACRSRAPRCRRRARTARRRAGRAAPPPRAGLRVRWGRPSAPTEQAARPFDTSLSRAAARVRGGGGGASLRRGRGGFGGEAGGFEEHHHERDVPGLAAVGVALDALAGGLLDAVDLGEQAHAGAGEVVEAARVEARGGAGEVGVAVVKAAGGTGGAGVAVDRLQGG